MRVVAVASQKGGSAKSTTVINLSAALARTGKHILCCDLDPQGHVGEGLGLNPRTYAHEMAEVIDQKVEAGDAVIVNVRENLDLIPSTIRLSELEIDLITQYRREDRLKNALATLSGYDYVLIDCPPSLGILTINALSAAGEVLIPMPAEYFAMLGVELLLNTLRRVKGQINPTLKVLGIVPTRVARTTNARETVDLVREQLGPNVHIYDCVIPETVKFREAAALGKTIFEHAPKSPGAVAYDELAQEIDSNA